LYSIREGAPHEDLGSPESQHSICKLGIPIPLIEAVKILLLMKEVVLLYQQYDYLRFKDGEMEMGG
jgi:hypothetical protein